MNTNLVIYHGGACYDGFTAAWVAAKFLHKPELRGMIYTDTPPTDEEVAGRDVYIVDFSFERAVCERIARVAESVKILDHHKTAEAELRGLPYAEFDMNRSGAGMAWDYFGGERPRPWLVNYVEDRDLWRFKLPNSQEVGAFIACQEQTLEAWDRLSALSVAETVQLGRGALAFETMAAKRAIDHAELVEFDGYTIPFVNTSYSLASVSAGLLCDGSRGEWPFAVAWFRKRDGKYQYSLRSRGENGADVSEIAKKYGGGGHRNAAGFTVDYLIPQAVVAGGQVR